jgi:hypothetical protein
MISVDREPGVCATEADWVAVKVGITTSVLVWEERGMGVRVNPGRFVEAESGERIRFTKILPKARATPANNTSAMENPSHCQPAIIRAWRVR